MFPAGWLWSICFLVASLGSNMDETHMPEQSQPFFLVTFPMLHNQKKKKEGMTSTETKRLLTCAEATEKQLRRLGNPTTIATRLFLALHHLTSSEDHPSKLTVSDERLRAILECFTAEQLSEISHQALYNELPLTHKTLVEDTPRPHLSVSRKITRTASLGKY